MLEVSEAESALTESERFALALLVDLSRVVPARSRSKALVALRPVDAPSAPSLAEGARQGWHITAADGEVRLPRPLLALVTDVAGAVREQRTAARDRFGRVPPEENVLVAESLERQPVIASIAARLRAAVGEAAGSRQVRLVRAWPEGRHWAAAFSHDLDVVTHWPVFTALRLVELARKRELRRAVRVTLAAVRSAVRDPVWDGVAQVLRTEQDVGVRSTWFILCGTPTLATMRAGDLTYLPESRKARRIVSTLVEAGHEIGLHGSFATMDSGTAFVEQRRRLASIAAVAPRGVRQHYLRMRPGATQRAMAGAGFEYDSTFGFADRNGFRLGVADVLPAWDADACAKVPLDLVPFIWMDRALSKYRGVEDPGGWVTDAQSLMDACRAAGGLWVGIWHPNLAPPLGFPGAPAAYTAVVRAAIARDAFVAPIGELVRWRRARRSVEVTTVSADGVVTAHATREAPHALLLEHLDGRAAERVLDA